MIHAKVIKSLGTKDSNEGQLLHQHVFFRIVDLGEVMKTTKKEHHVPPALPFLFIEIKMRYLWNPSAATN